MDVTTVGTKFSAYKTAEGNLLTSEGSYAAYLGTEPAKPMITPDSGTWNDYTAAFDIWEAGRLVALADVNDKKYLFSLASIALLRSLGIAVNNANLSPATAVVYTPDSICVNQWVVAGTIGGVPYWVGVDGRTMEIIYTKDTAPTAAFPNL